MAPRHLVNVTFCQMTKDSFNKRTTLVGKLRGDNLKDVWAAFSALRRAQMSHKSVSVECYVVLQALYITHPKFGPGFLLSANVYT